MKALVLIGGHGTRLRPLTYTTTKAMLPIVNQLYLDRLIRRLEASDVSDIVFAVSYLATDLQAYLEQQKSNYRVRMTCSIEPQPLGSAGALRFNSRFLDDTFLLLNGDILTDLDYLEMVRYHRAQKALVTVNTTQLPDPTRFGVIDTDSSGRVTSWQEKPTLQEARSNWVNVGVWVIEPSLLSSIPEHRFVSLEREVLQDLVSTRDSFYAFRSHGYWADIGTPESYAQIHRDILLGKVDEPIPGTKAEGQDIWVADDCTFAPTVSISGPVALGEGTSLGERATIVGPSVLGARCRIGPFVSIEDSVLWTDVEVGENAFIRNSIIARNVRISANARIIDSVIADDAVIDVPMLLSARIGPGTCLVEKSLAKD